MYKGKFDSIPRLPVVAGVLQQIFQILLKSSGWTLRQGAMHDIESTMVALVCTTLFGKRTSVNPFDIKVSAHALQLCLDRNIALRIPGC